MLRYYQPTMEEALDIGEPIYAVNKTKILEDWTIAFTPKKTNTAKTTSPLYIPVQPRPANKTPDSMSLAIYIYNRMYNS